MGDRWVRATLIHNWWRQCSIQLHRIQLLHLISVCVFFSAFLFFASIRGLFMVGIYIYTAKYNFYLAATSYIIYIHEWMNGTIHVFFSTSCEYARMLAWHGEFKIFKYFLNINAKELKSDTYWKFSAFCKITASSNDFSQSNRVPSEEGGSHRQLGWMM